MHSHLMHDHVIQSHVMHDHIMHGHVMHAHAVHWMLYVRINSNMPIVAVGKNSLTAACQLNF
jgi:hypothetical protein